MLAIIGPQQYESVVEAVHKVLSPRHDPFLDLVPPQGNKLTLLHYACLKNSARRLKRMLGTRQQVIIDEVGPTIIKGRSMAEAPEIDGAVYVASRRPMRVGEIATIKIEHVDEYDLHGTAVGF